MIAQYVCPVSGLKGDAVLLVAQQVPTTQQVLEKSVEDLNRPPFGR
jgi:hypothetical protein